MGIREDLAAFIAEARNSQIGYDEFLIGAVERLAVWAEGIERQVGERTLPPSPLNGRRAWPVARPGEEGRMTLRERVAEWKVRAVQSGHPPDYALIAVLDELGEWAEGIERRLAGQPSGEPPPQPRPGESDEAYWQRMLAEGRLAPEFDARRVGTGEGTDPPPPGV